MGHHLEYNFAGLSEDGVLGVDRGLPDDLLDHPGQLLQVAAEKVLRGGLAIFLKNLLDVVELNAEEQLFIAGEDTFK